MSGMIRSVRMTDGPRRDRRQPVIAVARENQFQIGQRFQKPADKPAVERRVIHDQNLGRFVHASDRTLGSNSAALAGNTAPMVRTSAEQGPQSLSHQE